MHGHHQESGGDRDFGWATDRYILECRGCNYVFLQSVSTNSEDSTGYKDESGNYYEVPNETVEYWPALTKRQRPEWMDVPLSSLGAHFEYHHNFGALTASLEEVYGALGNDLNTLAGIGIRTTFDIAAELLDINPRKTFKEKLDALVQDGHIGSADRSRLETLVDAGSASAHRGWKPTTAQLNTMMDILEHFVERAFVEPARQRKLDKEAKAMKEKVPAREPRPAVKRIKSP